MGDWYRRTHFARITNPADPNNFWLFKQPDLTVMSLLAHSADKRFPVRGLQSERENQSLIASQTPNGEKILLLINKPEFGAVHNNWKSNPFISVEQKNAVQSQGAVFTIGIEGLGEGDKMMSIIRLDNMHGNSYSSWMRLGMPDSVSASQYRSIGVNMTGIFTFFLPVILKINPSGAVEIISWDWREVKIYLAGTYLKLFKINY